MGDVEDVMMVVWEKVGGDILIFGVWKGDVYLIGDGFVLDFVGGKMFFILVIGVKYFYGLFLDKYELLGGVVDSDLGFLIINEVFGFVGFDSCVSMFFVVDNLVIFWMFEYGVFVVCGVLNVVWDKFGSLGGVLGVLVGDEIYDGEVIVQKFSGGEVFWNWVIKEFIIVLVVLVEQLKGLQVVIDFFVVINMVWCVVGGVVGLLGVKKGGQYLISGDGIVQDFVGGKVFFSLVIGVNVVEGEILVKYELLGGLVSSDLGFFIVNEIDGGFGFFSWIVRFFVVDKLVIFWVLDYGVFVVCGVMVVVWDKLCGFNGKFGVLVGDQIVDGDVVLQKFIGGMILWNCVKNIFIMDFVNLVFLLFGLQVLGQNQLSILVMFLFGKKFIWYWWWLGVVVLGVFLVVMVVLVVFGLCWC